MKRIVSLYTFFVSKTSHQVMFLGIFYIKNFIYLRSELLAGSHCITNMHQSNEHRDLLVLTYHSPKLPSDVRQ
jgi:hypothetical protein